MNTQTIRRLLLVAIAVIGLAVLAPVVSAHGNETVGADATPVNETAGDWATEMESHMTEYMGPGSVEQMETYMGLTVDEMAQDMNRNSGGYSSTHC